MIWFLNYEKGEYVTRSGELLDTYEDSFEQVWAEIRYNGGLLHLTIETIKSEKNLAA
jgi:hypothetical protein